MQPLRIVGADRVSGGYADFRIRDDFVASYVRVRDRARALGGLITSSGGLRDLREPATPGRSRTSLHYTARAIDLFIGSGMHSASDPYAIVPDESGPTPRWTIWCESRTPRLGDPLYDPSLIVQKTVKSAIWRKGAGYTLETRRGAFFSLSALFAAEGWAPIPARKGWKSEYLSCEWWHFQNQTGLRDHSSTFGDELLRIYRPEQVAASGLALDAVWSGQSFKETPVPRPPAPSTGDEKVEWIQTVLVATAGEQIARDGKPGTRTTAALKRFQVVNELPETGVCDGVTETALVQRALEHLGAGPFAAIGMRDDATIKAIKAFQRGEGLASDGVMGQNTRGAMMRRLV